MALVMRLRKLGARHKPFFRIVVAESATARDGRFVEELGWYDPKKEGDNSKLNEERVRYWLSKGAKPSETVRSILKKHNLLGTAAPAATPTTEAPAEAEAAIPEPEPTPPAEEPAEQPAEQPAEEPVEEPAEEPKAEEEEPRPETSPEATESPETEKE